MTALGEDGNMDFTHDVETITSIAAEKRKLYQVTWADQVEQEQDDVAELPPAELEHDDNQAILTIADTLNEEDEAQRGQGHMDPDEARRIVEEVHAEVEDAEDTDLNPMVVLIRKLTRGRFGRKIAAAAAEKLQQKVLQGHMNNVLAVFHPVHNVKHIHKVMLDAEKSKNVLVAHKDKNGAHTYDLDAMRKSAIVYETERKSAIDKIKAWKSELPYEERQTKIAKKTYKVYDYEGTEFPVNKKEFRKTLDACRKFRALEHALDKLILGNGTIKGEGIKEKVEFKKGSVIDKYYKATLAKASSEKAMKHHTRTHVEPNESPATPNADMSTPQQSMFTSTGILAAILHQRQGAVGTQQKTARSRSVGRPRQTRTDARPGWMNNLGM